MVIECGRHQARPLNSNCWELWELRETRPRDGGEPRERWRSMGKYPSTLRQALAMLFEIEARDRNGDAVASLDRAMAVCSEIRDELVAAARAGDADAD